MENHIKRTSIVSKFMFAPKMEKKNTNFNQEKHILQKIISKPDQKPQNPSNFS